MRACHRVLKPGGRLAYFNIFVAEHLPPNERRRIGRRAPHGVYTRAEQQALLRAAGFARVRETDVTPEYLRVQRALYEANARHERALRRALGSERFEEAQASREQTLDRIEKGEVRRSLFVAERLG